MKKKKTFVMFGVAMAMVAMLGGCGNKAETQNDGNGIAGSGVTLENADGWGYCAYNEDKPATLFLFKDDTLVFCTYDGKDPNGESQSDIPYDEVKHCYFDEKGLAITYNTITEGGVCSNLENVVFSDRVTGIVGSENEFFGSVTSIEIPNSVKEIGAGSFFGFSSLESITIPDSVTSIAVNAFEGCSSLTDVEINSSKINIDAGAFKGCSSLSSQTLEKLESLGYDSSKDA